MKTQADYDIENIGKELTVYGNDKPQNHMKQKDVNTLLAVLGRQAADCAKLSDQAERKDDHRAKAFHAGAHMALQRAIEYTKDAQAGILTE
jgi:hypothetical protein